ncbi:MAG: lysophospholipid acyltransferase family protein [Ferruginibacter sp.]
MLTNLFPNPNGQWYFVLVSRAWMKVWLFLIGCSLKIKGHENFKQGETYVIVFNHNALLDVPLSAPFVPGPNKTIAKASFAKVPLFGLFYKRGAVLVNRKDEKSRVKSFEEMKEVLSGGIHMSIYPEGTRNRTKETMKPFYDGAFKLAKAANKKIMPCVISGTKRAMPINKTFYLLPGLLQMEFLQPVESGQSKIADLKSYVFDVMKKKYEETYRS